MEFKSLSISFIVTSSVIEAFDSVGLESACWAGAWALASGTALVNNTAPSSVAVASDTSLHVLRNEYIILLLRLLLLLLLASGPIPVIALCLVLRHEVDPITAIHRRPSDPKLNLVTGLELKFGRGI